MLDVQAHEAHSSDDEPETRELWSSRSKHVQLKAVPGEAGGADSRQAGNRAFAAGHLAQAVALYSRAIELCEKCNVEEHAALLSNRARTYLKNGNMQQVRSSTSSERLLRRLGARNKAHFFCWFTVQAEADANSATKLLPAWPKPYYSLAQLHLQSANYQRAVRACRQGEALLDNKSNLHNDFLQLLDQIAVVAALSGDWGGFDGRQLEVGRAST